MKNENKKLIVLLILGLIVHQHQVDAGVGAILKVASFAWDAFGVINTAHDSYSKFTTPSVGDVLDETEKIIESIDKQGDRIEQKLQQSVETLLTRLPLMAEIAGDVRLLNTYIVRIDELYADLKIFMETPDYFDETAIRYLTKSWTSRNADDARGSISRMYSLIVPQILAKMKKSLFVLLAQESEGHGLEVCDTGAPPQQRLVELFNIAMSAEMKTFAMYGFGLLLEGYLDNDNYTVDLERALEQIQVRAAEYQDILLGTVSSSGRLFRRCDPPGGYERGVTVFEFERFLQSVLVTGRAFRRNNRCSQNCKGEYGLSRVKFDCTGVGCDYSPQSCFGYITKCRSMEDKAFLCPASEASSRRYEWYSDTNDDPFGDKDMGCPVNVMKALGDGCPICRCVCVEDDIYAESHHFISLREQMADVANNMVVTGLAFVAVDRLVHVKVMQGKVGPGARVLKDSTSWVELEKIRRDSDSMDYLKELGNGETEKMILDKDVASLTWEQRRINLDAITVWKYYVVTGVRFRRMTEMEEGNIRLELHATYLDGDTGELDLDSSIWMSGEDMPYADKDLKNERTAYEGEGFRNPLKSKETMIDSTPYTFIDLDWSSFKDDAAQTTIPLLDAVPVISSPPTALSGVGLYHKAQPGYGGFLTFVLEGIDQTSFLLTDIRNISE